MVAAEIRWRLVKALDRDDRSGITQSLIPRIGIHAREEPPLRNPARLVHRYGFLPAAVQGGVPGQGDIDRLRKRKQAVFCMHSYREEDGRGAEKRQEGEKTGCLGRDSSKSK